MGKCGLKFVSNLFESKILDKNDVERDLLDLKFSEKVNIYIAFCPKLQIFSGI